MHMINLARLNGEVHLFVVHLVSEPEVIHLLENVPHNICEVEVENVMPDSGQIVGEVNDVEVKRGEVHGHGEEGDCEEIVPVSEEICEGDGVVEGEIETKFDVATERWRRVCTTGKEHILTSKGWSNKQRFHVFKAESRKHAARDQAMLNPAKRGSSTRPWKKVKLP
ncbi:hypothetical protein LR48_Vigan07g182700 [Vigna angularis]|uniref:Uncharacterized protein n=1 Tax=Phaseolus angularis TaxID=3914 RepID=A0A0L9UZC0_PHAAN|nr:hypothetical protein LR48_Vigan07g182700 [Vigna angularis]